jgi:hypothetical protein
MPATDYQGTPSHSHSPFSSFGRSLLSLRRDTPASSHATPPPDVADLDAFQRRLAARLTGLLHGDDPELLSAAWIRRLLGAFLACHEEFLARRRRGALVTEKPVAEFGERAVRALDVCNAARDGVGQVRRWARLAGAAASVLLAPGAVREGKLRRARKALSDLSALLLVDDAAALLASRRNRSFGRSARSSPSSTHLRSLSWSVSRTWSSARQLQAVSAGLSSPPRAHDEVAASAYAMSSLLHLAAWSLVAAVPCPDRAAAVQQPVHHLPAAPPRAAFPWAPPLLALQERIADEGRRKDRRTSPGLLRETHALEKAAQRLAEVIETAPVSALASDREAEILGAAAELAAVCAAMKDGLDPLEKQIREVFHRIVRSRMEGLDSPVINAD